MSARQRQPTSTVSRIALRGLASSKHPPSSPPPPPGMGANGLIGLPPNPRPPPSRKPPQPTPTPATARMPSVIEVDVKNFVALLKSPVPVILDCYASWCDPCKKLTPVLERIVGKYPGRLILAKLDVDNHQELAAQLNVSSLPAVFGLCEGKLVDRFVGMPTEPVLAGFLDKMLSIVPISSGQEGKGEPSPAEKQEAVLKRADALLTEGTKEGGSGETATEAGALYRQVYEELGKEDTPATYLQARCLAGLARCALGGGAREEAKELVGMLKRQHKADMETMPVRKRGREGGREGWVGRNLCGNHSRQPLPRRRSARPSPSSKWPWRPLRRKRGRPLKTP